MILNKDVLKNAVNVCKSFKDIALVSKDNECSLIAYSIKTKITMLLPTIEAGDVSFCIQPKVLYDMLANGNGDVKLTVEGNILHVSMGKVKYRYSVRDVPAGWFEAPAYTKIKYDCLVDNMVDGYNFVCNSISTDETRYFLNGVYVEFAEDSLNFVATDGRRLSKTPLTATLNNGFIPDDTENSTGVIVPREFFTLFSKMKDSSVSLTITDSCIIAQSDHGSIISSFIDGTFPNYKKVIPATSKEITVLKKEITEAIKACTLLSDENYKIILTYKDNSIVLESSNQSGDANWEIHAEGDSEEIVFGMNYKYAMDAVSSIPDDSVKIKYTNAQKAFMFHGASEEQFHVVMPMSLEG